MTTMKKEEKKKGNFPNLRFPEFQGEWEETKLGEIAEIIGGGTPSTANEKYWNGDIQWFTPSEIKSNYVSRSERTITQLGLTKSSAKLLPMGAILITTRATIGEVAIAKEECSTNQGFQSLVVMEGVYNIFVANWIKQNKKELIKRAKGSTFAEISKSEIEKIPILLPVTTEQNKIAKFLSLLDERISTQSKIIEQYKSLIKGINEMLFSQKIRFKNSDGGNFPIWESKKLGEIGETFTGLSGKNKDDFGKGKPYIQYKQIFDSSTIQVSNCGLVNVLNEEVQNRVQYGDIFFTTSSETPNEIGMSSVLLNEVDEMFLNSFCFGFRPFSFKILNPLFASYLFRGSVFRDEIVKLAQGSTRYNISKVELMKLSISIPSTKEQIKIADFLSKISNKIETEKQLLNKLEKQKQYLLQQMLI